MLTSDPSGGMLRSDDYPKEHRRPHRPVAGAPGPAHSQDPYTGAVPWPGRGAVDSTPVGRSLFRGLRIALFGPAAARGQEVDQRKVGREREQPQGAVLFADRKRPRAASREDERVAAADPSNGVDSE